MKVLKFHPLTINPIHRDLIVVTLAGLLISTMLISMAYMVMAQF